MSTVRRTSKDDPRLPAGYVVARHLPLHVQRHLREAGKVWLAYHKHATPDCDWYVWVRTEAEAIMACRSDAKQHRDRAAAAARRKARRDALGAADEVSR